MYDLSYRLHKFFMSSFWNRISENIEPVVIAKIQMGFYETMTRPLYEVLYEEIDS